MHSGGMFIRKGKGGRILLLGGESPGIKGRIALAREACANWHIAVRTQGYQHPQCIDISLGARGFSGYPYTDTSLYSKCYVVEPDEPGSFRVGLRWRQGHSPYPAIIEMEAWVFGIYFESRNYPKAPDDYLWIADVEVMAGGRVEVNGQNAGCWHELLA